MYLAIALLHFLTKTGLIIILAFTRFLQYRSLRIQTVFWIGDMIVGTILFGTLFSIIESRLVMYISVLMIISTTLLVDYAIAEQMKLDQQKSKIKLAFAQVAYLIELGALMLAYRYESWGTTELTLLNLLSNLFSG